ncbi:hypothetical protein [uncultured Cedecea sp.]|uniref:T6SS effector phospholipase Tle3 domain-containing protein n=1 Tax=uncultured Cedecea sp. TaxID=988762 RepID=UPI00262DB0F9|nr:hypothetical protein [uncultured Cedecea sp.]
MNNDKISPTRKIDVLLTDNGSPFSYSITSHKNIQVHAEMQPPLHLPGLIIFVHGVNSEGEWYEAAEKSLCEGLNKRLGLYGRHILVANEYTEGGCDSNGGDKKGVSSSRKIIKEGRSPVIRFYWGYRAADNETDKYAIPLKNKQGDDYYDLTPEQRKKKGPFYWGGGPFQNGCNQLVSLWSDKGFDNSPSALGISLPLNTQLLNGECDQLLTTGPPRHYCAHAAGRLVKLIKTIRDKHPEDTVTILSHGQGTMIALAAAAIETPDALFMMNSPYALDNEPMTYISYPMDEIISKEAREATFADIVKKVAENRERLQRQGYERLLAGVCSEGESWTPTGKTYADIPERDNHGTTWIYYNPHDTAVDLTSLRRIGWLRLSNTRITQFTASHPLFKRAGDTLYVRMLGPDAPCGAEPNMQAHSSASEEKKGLAGKTKTLLQNAACPESLKGPESGINAPAVPEPLSAEELKNCDQGYRYGQIDPGVNASFMNGYRYYISLYGSFEENMALKKLDGDCQSEPDSKEDRSRYERHSREEILKEIRTYIQRATDPGTLPRDKRFMSRVIAYDLPIGYCWHSWDRESLAELRYQADWLESDDYYRHGQLALPAIPVLIRKDSGINTLMLMLIKGMLKKLGC